VVKTYKSIEIYAPFDSRRTTIATMDQISKQREEPEAQTTKL